VAPGCGRARRRSRQSGAKAHFVELDVTSQDQWTTAVADVERTFGALHVLMNIVGSNALVKLPEVDIDEWNKIFETNVTGTLRGIQTCAPLMKKSGGGSIVNIGSVAGITGSLGTAYSSSKWALEGLSRSAMFLASDESSTSPAPTSWSTAAGSRPRPTSATSGHITCSPS
jgi:NAD(P)-dependent dehydrogenase (short-subunit alcohol dehydrogenase family)